jgi:hypothetical protein
MPNIRAITDLLLRTLIFSGCTPAQQVEVLSGFAVSYIADNNRRLQGRASEAWSALNEVKVV